MTRTVLPPPDQVASEAWAFLAWVLALVQGGSRPTVLYDVDGRVPAEEWIDPQLEGYRATAPVRWGNAAGEHTSTTSSARSWTAPTSVPQAAGS
jgi:hypothetical protein